MASWIRTAATEESHAARQAVKLGGAVSYAAVSEIDRYGNSAGCTGYTPHLDAKVGGAAGASRAVGERLRRAFSRRDEIAQRLCLERWIDDEHHHRDHAARDRHEIALRIVGKILVEAGVHRERRICRHEERVAVEIGRA